ncbi:hypothetical protein [Mycobacterium asiaticum]|uniref:Uncharacterized protein n=1 Tax=Mycobacterium asiaticum TaxID=1790 RepID=A0A1A3L397_MYCAS|nr:hypothetical protein [Mycobacterium asiaticum]OBJ90641.1 hypothetical protein A5640_23505 [Mycobacterium asiaticum]
MKGVARPAFQWPSLANALSLGPAADVVSTSQIRDNAQGAAPKQRIPEHTRAFFTLLAWVIGCTAIHLFIVLAVYSNAVVLLQYYAVNYDYGFVRRGLAGELISLFPYFDYFTVAYAIVWASAITWIICLAVLVWIVLSPDPSSQRRRMLALLIPVLPFSLSYAVYNSHPEIWGMSAFLLFSIAMRSACTDKSKVIYSAVYGVLTAVLALIHEAIPVQFALGAVLAVTVLSKDSSRSMKRVLSVVAVAPGVLTLFLIAVLGRRNIGNDLCAQVPHRFIDDPVGTVSVPHSRFGFILHQFQRQSDFHDWVCEKTLPFWQLDIFGAARVVASYGFLRLLISIVLGIIIGVVTIAAVRNVCAVALASLMEEVRTNRVLVALAALLIIPLFITGLDWTRWCTLIALDVAIIYILYAIDKPEMSESPTRRNWLMFVVTVVVFAAIPLGDLNNAGY